MAKSKKKSSDSLKQKKSAAKSQEPKKTLKKASSKENAAVSQSAGKAAASKAAASKARAPIKAKNPKPKEQDEDPIDFEDFEGSDESLEGLDLDEIEEEEVEEADEELEADGDEGGSVEESSNDEIVLTDAEGNRYCRARDCDQIAVVEAYCRYHYLLFWRKIQVRKKILDDGKLERYVEELTSRYPDKFVEMIRRDLRTEKDFMSAIQELEIDESGLENEDEDDTQSFVDEIRGMGGGDSEGVEEDF